MQDYLQCWEALGQVHDARRPALEGPDQNLGRQPAVEDLHACTHQAAPDVSQAEGLVLLLLVHPDHQTQVALACVDGVGDRQVVDHPGLPVFLAPPLAGQAVVEGGEAGALEGGHPQDVLEEDCAAGCCEAP